ncbi:hypothetical protein niasHT_018296 [Heterodera trifolii]|uniref:Uncharacterized protein n=1 Tax=Heterodera trifolii TaxID=157864 RepID=A0ABD2KZJ3_9BILA
MCGSVDQTAFTSSTFVKRGRNCCSLPVPSRPLKIRPMLWSSLLSRMPNAFLLKFAAHIGATPIVGRFTPGSLTNQIQKNFKQPPQPIQQHQPMPTQQQEPPKQQDDWGGNAAGW